MLYIVFINIISYVHMICTYNTCILIYRVYIEFSFTVNYWSLISLYSETSDLGKLLVKH